MIFDSSPWNEDRHGSQLLTGSCHDQFSLRFYVVGDVTFSYLLSDELYRFLGEIKRHIFTVSNSEITTFDFHCS